MNYLKIKAFVFLLPTVFASTSLGKLEQIKISSGETLANGRAVFEQKASIKGGASAQALATMKRERLTGDFAGCAKAASAARSSAPELGFWVASQELECANLLYQASKDNSRLSAAIKSGLSQERKLNQAPGAPRLRNRLIEAQLNLIESDLKSNRARAQETIGRMQSQVEWMDDKSRAKLWRFAGETSFMQQRLEEARAYYNRSLQLMDSEEIRARLASLDATTLAKTKAANQVAKVTAPAAAPTPAIDLEATPQEVELVTRMTTNLKAGDLVPVVEDGMKLIVDHPGSSRAKWATDRIQEIYIQLGDKTDEQYIPLREKVIKEMLKADSDRIAEWARIGYNKLLYQDAYRLSKKALDSMGDSARSTKVYSLAAEAALHLDKFDDAKDLYVTLVRKHSGTATSREALLRIGLIEYRQKNYQAAQAAFERLLVFPQIENLEVTARHWLWRSLQKSKDEARAKQAAEILAEKFPFSYYGLRARIELNNGVFEWPKDESPKVQASLWLTKEEQAAYKRAKSLIEGGWFDEAQLELQSLPPAVKPEEKALRAKLLASAFSYPQAVKLINEVWEKNPDYRREPFLSISFPREFQTSIAKQAEVRKLEPELIMSLIKQESSYNIRAVSTSSAYGLMQMIPPTAKEIAQDLKLLPLLLPEDMFKPDQNIQMGTYYLAKVLKKWSGHVPLGLASYNAGPHRVEKWMRSRPSLKEMPQLQTSDPDVELWFDELPWDETSFYVKAILRNLILYRAFEAGKLTAKNPIWSSN